jgi:protease I
VTVGDWPPADGVFLQGGEKSRGKEFEVNMARIIIIAGDGSSSGQLQYSVYRLLEEGFDVTVAAPVRKGLYTVIDQREEGWDYDTEKRGYTMWADASLDEVDPFRFDALVLPGWRAAEALRNIDRCIQVVRHFLENNKPIASICQGPRILLAAGVKGRRLTGIDMIKPDIIASGNTFVEAASEAVVDGNIVTVSRRPYYYVWMRAFLSMLKERGIKPS